MISPVDAGIHVGNFEVEIEIDGTCTLDATYTVQVFDAPIVNVANVSTDTCFSGTLELEGTATGASPLTYLWTGPNGFTSTLQNINIAGIDETYNGLYNLQVTSATGCVANNNIIVDNLLPETVTPVSYTHLTLPTKRIV